MERVEGRLKQMFEARKYGKKTLRTALQTAKKAGLTSAFSEVVRDVEAFLGKVIMTAYKLRITEQKYPCTRKVYYELAPTYTPTKSLNVRISPTRTLLYQRKRTMWTSCYQRERKRKQQQPLRMRTYLQRIRVQVACIINQQILNTLGMHVSKG